MEVVSRYILTANYDTKEFWRRMIWDEFRPGGFLSGDRIGKSVEDARTSLLIAEGVCRYVNGNTGYSNVSMTRLAGDLGWDNTNNHQFGRRLRLLLASGVLTKDGLVKRAPKLRLSIPAPLVETHSALEESIKGGPFRGTDLKDPVQQDLQRAENRAEHLFGTGSDPWSTEDPWGVPKLL